MVELDAITGRSISIARMDWIESRTQCGTRLDLHWLGRRHICDVGCRQDLNTGSEFEGPSQSRCGTDTGMSRCQPKCPVESSLTAVGGARSSLSHQQPATPHRQAAKPHWQVDRPFCQALTHATRASCYNAKAEGSGLVDILRRCPRPGAFSVALPTGTLRGRVSAALDRFESVRLVISGIILFQPSIQRELIAYVAGSV